jgi:hypothetical protein
MPLDMRYAGYCTCRLHLIALRHPTHPTTDYNSQAKVIVPCDCGRRVQLTPAEISVRNIRFTGRSEQERQALFETVAVEAELILYAAVASRQGTPLPPMRRRQLDPEVAGEETWEWELSYSIE